MTNYQKQNPMSIKQLSVETKQGATMNLNRITRVLLIPPYLMHKMERRNKERAIQVYNQEQKQAVHLLQRKGKQYVNEFYKVTILRRKHAINAFCSAHKFT